MLSWPRKKLQSMKQGMDSLLLSPLPHKRLLVFLLNFLPGPGGLRESPTARGMEIFGSQRSKLLVAALFLLQILWSTAVVEVSATLSNLESTIQCYEEHEDPRYSDQRLCIMENLVVHNNTIYFVSSNITSLPSIRIGWELPHYPTESHLPIRVVKPWELPQIKGQMKEVREAGLFHQQHVDNFYHLFTEILPTIHYIICKYMNRCTYQKHDDVQMYWVFEKRPEIPRSMAYAMPPGIRDALQCLTPFPVQNIYDVTVVEKQSLLLLKSVVGLARRARFYHQKKDEWRTRFQDPPPLEYMQSYRTRLADCIGFDFVNAVAPINPIRITLVNRHYAAGRHILNADKLRDQILALPVVKSLGNVEVKIVFLEGSLREQAKVIWNTSIYMWPHGATMAHTFFLPRGAQAIEIVQWVVEDPIDQHIWVQGIRAAFGLNIGLDTVVNDDRTKVFFNFDMLMAPGSQYLTFNDTEKRMLLEDWKCPMREGVDGYECFKWFHWGMSCNLKFDLLRPKLEAAIANLTQQASQFSVVRLPLRVGSRALVSTDSLQAANGLAGVNPTREPNLGAVVSIFCVGCLFYGLEYIRRVSCKVFHCKVGKTVCSRRVCSL